jgi:hypothetical protein
MKTPAICAACGPAQANHTTLWLANSSDVFALKLAGIRNALVLRFFSNIGERTLWLITRIAFMLGTLLGAVELQDDIENARSDRSSLLWQEARKRGIIMRQLFLFKKPTDSFEIKINGRRHFFQSIPVPAHLVVVETLGMDDKITFKQMLREANLPVPQSYSVRTFSRAKAILARLGNVCVKPQSGSNGRHTYPFVQTETELAAALTSATEICVTASIEEHLEGNLCRATCVDGKLIGFLESLYPTIVGDGRSSIEALITRANAEKPEGVADIVLTDSHKDYIRRRGFELRDILPDRISLPLTYRAGWGQGGRNREYGRAIHPSFIPRIEEAARLTKLPVVGFDIIIPNAQEDEAHQRWGFIEANSLPWIDLHQAALYGEKIDLSPYVWDLWK